MITEVPFLNARIIGQKYLNVSDIKIGWMPRGIDWDYVEQLAEVLRNGQKFPEDVQVFEDNELTDGLHRMEGYKKVETITIPVSVWNCPKENRTALKIYLNSLHGKQLSTKEKQESYMSLLKENPNLKDSASSLILGVSERTIQRWKPDNLKQKRLSNEEVQKIQELKEEGKTQREIAEEIGISEAAISKNLTSDKCQKLSSSSPTPTTPEPDDDKALPISEVLGSNIIKAPVEFKKPPVQKEVHVDPDYPDDDDEDEEDIEIPDDEKKVYRVVKKEPTLEDDWDIVVESIFNIAKRTERLRGHLHEVFMPGEAELVLSGPLQQVQNFLSYLKEFVPDDTTIFNERR